jgi:hypothetical protein
MPIPRKTAAPRKESRLPKSTPDRTFLSLRYREARPWTGPIFERAGCAAAEGVPVRPLPDWWLDSGSRPKPEAWPQPLPRQAPNLAGFGPRTFKLLNLSRCPALKPEEPLKDDRVALGPVRLWGLCAGGSASGSFRVHGKGPPGMGGPNPQRAPRGARVRAPHWLPRDQGNTRPTPPTPPPGGHPLDRKVCTRLGAGRAAGRLRGRRGSKRDPDSARRLVR